MHRTLLALVAAHCFAAAVPQRSSAQVAQLGIAGGLAIPTGAYGETRTAGPLIRGMLSLGRPSWVARFRCDFEGAWLLDQADRDGPDFGSSRQGTLRAVGVIALVVAGPAGGRLAPYVVAGAGAQRLRVEGVRNPYGLVTGVRAGAGIRARLGRAAVHAEVTPHWALTDFGTGRDFGVGSYVPIAVGISF